MGNCQKQQTVSENVLSKNHGPVTELKITNFSWESAYQGLFDYESSKIKQSSILAKQDIILEKNKGILNAVPLNQQNQSEKENQLFQIVKKTNYFKILPIYMEIDQFMVHRLMWLIVRTLPNQKYVINQKDIIKFGKQKIKIKQLVPATIDNHSAVIDLNQIKVSKQVYEDLKYKEGLQLQDNVSMKNDLATSSNMPNITSQNQVQSIVTTNQINCRICLQPGCQTDPLISPCKCTGSVRYIHLKCLRTWLGKRLNISKHKHCITLNWQKLCCEMCQQAYKYRIYLDNKKFYTVQIPKPEKPYVVFQVMKKSNDKSTGKIYQFVSLSQKSQLSIGRKKDVDVRVSDDISVSRHHASFTYDKQSHTFILQDNKSKFGTLVLIKKNLCIRPNVKNIGFQIGAEVYRFESFRGQVIQSKLNKNENYEDMDDYLNLQDQDDQQVGDEQNSDDSEGRFEEPHQEVGQLPMSPELGSPVLRRSGTLVEGNLE